VLHAAAVSMHVDVIEHVFGLLKANKNKQKSLQKGVQSTWILDLGINDFV